MFPANQPSTQTGPVQSSPQFHSGHHDDHMLQPPQSLSAVGNQYSQQQQSSHLHHHHHHPSLSTAGTTSSTIPVHRSTYINNSQHNSLPHPQSSPQPVVTITTSMASPMTTGSTTIPITHTGNHVHRGNTVYGKFLGAQQSMGSSNHYGHHVEEMGNGDKRGLEGGGTSDRSSW